MKLKTLLLTFASAALMACAAGVANGQTPTGAETEEKLTRQQAMASDILDVIERAKEAQRKAFAGSWEGVFTPEAGGPPPFRILFTFGLDGTVVATDAGPPSPHLASSEHGAWDRSGPNEFLVTYKQLLFDKDGNLDSLFKARVKFKLNEGGTGINGQVIVDLFDLQGNKFLSGAGTIKCTKIRVEPLD